MTAELPLAQLASLRPTMPLRHGRHQKTNKLGSATEESVLPPKNQRQKLHWHHELHFHFALPPPPYILSTYPRRRRVTLVHCKHSPFGGEGEWFGSTPKSTLSFSDLPRRRIELAIVATCTRYPVSPQRKIALATGRGK